MDRHGIHSVREFFPMLEERTGRRAASAACALCLWFFLAHTAVFARLWAELLRVYLASGALTTVLGILPILFGILYLRKARGSGISVRVCRVMEITLSVLSAVLVWLLGDRTPLGWLRDGASYPERFGVWFPGIAPGRWEIAAALLLLITFLFAAAWGIRCVRASYEYLYPLCVEFYHGQAVRAVRERLRGVHKKLPGLLGAGAGTGADAGADVGADAKAQATESERFVWENGMITETVKLCGTEFADELAAVPEGRKSKFFGMKVTKKLSELPYAGTVSRYGERITAELTAAHIWWWVALLTIYALTVGFADAFAAVSFYRAYNLQILLPAMLLFFAAIAAIARRRGAAGYAR